MRKVKLTCLRSQITGHSDGAGGIETMLELRAGQGQLGEDSPITNAAPSPAASSKNVSLIW